MKGEFLCPLCRGFSNDVLPILPDCIKEVSDHHKVVNNLFYFFLKLYVTF